MIATIDDEEVYDSIFAIMAKSDDDDSDSDAEAEIQREAVEEVTLSDIKQNLHAYSVKRLRSLAGMLIDSLTELTNEKDLMNNSLEIFQDEKLALVSKISELEEQIFILVAD